MNKNKILPAISKYITLKESIDIHQNDELFILGKNKYFQTLRGLLIYLKEDDKYDLILDEINDKRFNEREDEIEKKIYSMMFMVNDLLPTSVLKEVKNTTSECGVNIKYGKVKNGINFDLEWKGKKTTVNSEDLIVYYTDYANRIVGASVFNRSRRHRFTVLDDNIIHKSPYFCYENVYVTNSYKMDRFYTDKTLDRVNSVSKNNMRLVKHFLTEDHNIKISRNVYSFDKLIDSDFFDIVLRNNQYINGVRLFDYVMAHSDFYKRVFYEKIKNISLDKIKPKHIEAFIELRNELSKYDKRMKANRKTEIMSYLEHLEPFMNDSFEFVTEKEGFMYLEYYTKDRFRISQSNPLVTANNIVEFLKGRIEFSVLSRKIKITEFDLVAGAIAEYIKKILGLNNLKKYNKDKYIMITGANGTLFFSKNKSIYTVFEPSIKDKNSKLEFNEIRDYRQFSAFTSDVSDGYVYTKTFYYTYNLLISIFKEPYKAIDFLVNLFMLPFTQMYKNKKILVVVKNKKQEEAFNFIRQKYRNVFLITSPDLVQVINMSKYNHIFKKDEYITYMPSDLTGDVFNTPLLKLKEIEDIIFNRIVVSASHAFVKYGGEENVKNMNVSKEAIIASLNFLMKRHKPKVRSDFLEFLEAELL